MRTIYRTKRRQVHQQRKTRRTRTFYRTKMRQVYQQRKTRRMRKTMTRRTRLPCSLNVNIGARRILSHGPPNVSGKLAVVVSLSAAELLQCERHRADAANVIGWIFSTAQSAPDLLQPVSSRSTK